MFVFRIAIKELNIATTSTISQENPLDLVPSAALHETVELQNLMRSLDLTSTTESDAPVEKPKRVRTRRKKTSSDKEKTGNEDSNFQTQSIGVFVNEAVAANKGVKQKNKKIFDKSVQSPQKTPNNEKTFTFSSRNFSKNEHHFSESKKRAG